MDEDQLDTTNLLNNAINEQKPLTTRSESKQYKDSKEKAKKKINILDVDNSFGKLNLNENQIANGLKKIQWKTKKYF